MSSRISKELEKRLINNGIGLVHDIIDLVGDNIRIARGLPIEQAKPVAPDTVSPDSVNSSSSTTQPGTGFKAPETPETSKTE